MHERQIAANLLEQMITKRESALLKKYEHNPKKLQKVLDDISIKHNDFMFSGLPEPIRIDPNTFAKVKGDGYWPGLRDTLKAWARYWRIMYPETFEINANEFIYV